MTRIWEEVVEEGIVTEKSSRATELIIVLVILAIIAFAVGCLFNLASPSSEASSCSLGTGFIESNQRKLLKDIHCPKMNGGERGRRARSAPTFIEPNAQGGGASKLTDNSALERAKPPTLIITAYCPKSCCCGEFADGITASGHIIEPNDCFVAAPPEYPFGTRLSIPGYAGGLPVPVLDRGGAIQGNRLDVFFSSHQEALAWGVQEMRFEQ